MTSLLTAAIRRQVRIERLERRLSQVALAKSAGMSPQTLLRIELGAEKGRKVGAPDTDQLDALCQAMGLSLVDLFRRAEERVESSVEDSDDGEDPTQPSGPRPAREPGRRRARSRLR